MVITRVLVGFVRTLRHAGVAATPDRVHAMLAAVGELGATDPKALYWAGRLTLCSEPDDLPVYDATFAAYFGGRVAVHGLPLPPRPPLARVSAPLATGAPGREINDGEPPEILALSASPVEVLRHRDVAALSTRERAEPRRLVVLLDVSGSMTPYADALLRFGHAAVRRRPALTEVFTMGTRLTRVTLALRHRDPDTALRAAGAAIPDWHGGTRLADSLRAFLTRWGRRGTARGAVVVICSDGWERGDPADLAAQLDRLSRLAYRLVWVNPHRGKTGYAPLAGGMAAALPYLDDFVAGHSLAALEDLVGVIARA